MKNQSIILIGIICIANFGLVLSACTYRASDGSQYDLSALNVEYSITQNDYNYKVTVCKNLNSLCYGLSQAVCRISVWGGVEYACGTAEAQTMRDGVGGPASGVAVYYDGGEACGGTPRTSTINIICDQSTEGTLVSVNEATSCDLEFTMRSKHACPAGGAKHGVVADAEGLSGGSVFLIIVLVSVVVYIVGGVVYRTKKVGAEGIDRLPNWGFWSQIPGLVKDGIFFTKDKLFTLVGGSRL